MVWRNERLSDAEFGLYGAVYDEFGNESGVGKSVGIVQRTMDWLAENVYASPSPAVHRRKLRREIEATIDLVQDRVSTLEHMLQRLHAFHTVIHTAEERGEDETTEVGV